MLVNRRKKPYELIFDIRKFDSFKTNCLKQRRVCRLYLRTHTNIARSVIRSMTLRELRVECHRILSFWDFFRINYGSKIND